MQLTWLELTRLGYPEWEPLRACHYQAYENEGILQ